MELKIFFSVHTLLLFVALTFVLKMSTSKEVVHSFPWQLLDAIKPKISPLLISPSSVRDSLEVAYFGSDGETSRQIRRSLQIVGTKELIASKFKDRKSDSENKFFISTKLEVAKKFKRTLKSIGGKVKKIDFSLRKAARKIINWIGTKTGTQLKGINSLRKLISNHTSTVEVNVVNFSAEWEHPFESKIEKRNVTIMRGFGDYSHGILEDLNVTAVVLPFKNSKSNMLVLLPSKNEKLETIIERIKNYDIDSIDSRLKKIKLDVYFPKIDLNTHILLNKALNKLNFKEPLSTNANFTSLLEGRKNKHKHQNYIQNVLQSTALKVGFKKIGLKSATVVQWKRTPRIKNSKNSVNKIYKKPHRKPRKNVFYVKRPFIFAIREGKNILSIGGVSKFT